ncbi:MAG: hypothetical protein U9N61_11980 [Euryarchaeota archaeon]|nr:hypothetical protein [Euryarchaeota archaeon]
MAYSMEYGVGYEAAGNILVAPYCSGVSISSGGVGGDYCLRIEQGEWANYLTTIDESSKYVAAHLKKTSSDIGHSIIAVLDDDKEISVQMNSGANNYILKVDGTTVATGSIAMGNDWYHLKIYFNISNTGSVQIKIDGIDDIDYSGDTLPGTSSNIKSIKINASGWQGQNVYVDNFTFGNGGWPGDLRFEWLAANEDTATMEWDISSGTDGYAVIDERGPDTADYIEAIAGKKALFEIEDWVANSRLPYAVVLWIYAKKNAATTDQIKLIDSDGTNENVGDAQDLAIANGYKYKVLEEAPDGTSWDETDVDDLQIGVLSYKA